MLAACSKEERSPPQAEERGSQDALTGEIDRSHAGDLMPAVALSHPEGKELNTGALSGTPVLINLWATWCAPCVKEMPTLDAIAAEYGDRLRVLTISQDLEGKAKVVPFFDKEKFDHLEPWLDPDNKAMDNLGGLGVLPTTILYSASGEEIARVVGGFDWESAEAKALIDEAVEPA